MSGDQIQPALPGHVLYWESHAGVVSGLQPQDANVHVFRHDQLEEDGGRGGYHGAVRLVEFNQELFLLENQLKQK